jgi:ubiquinone/menaquinone biosynthesis C-methylase UbiE
MSEQEGWDLDAALYDEHWQPVLDAATQRFLARLDPLVRAWRVAALDGGATDVPSVLDLGTGSGALLVAAAQRWPGLRYVGLDQSAGMVARAVARATAAGLPGDGPALRWMTADAASVPLPDASVRLVVSSFVLQLVPDRRRVLDEVRRLLQPDGWLAFVTWMAADELTDADIEFDEAVIDLGIEERDPDERAPCAGDFESAEQAGVELAEAGFGDVALESDEIVHRWTRDGYLDFKEAWDERELFETLGRTQRDHLVARVRERWEPLPDDAFEFRAPLVSVLARRR